MRCFACGCASRFPCRAGFTVVGSSLKAVGSLRNADENCHTASDTPSKVLFVSRDLLANGRGRWLAFAASVVVSAAMLFAQGTEVPCCAEIPAVTPTGQAAAPAGAPYVASPTAAELLAASAPVAAPDFQFALPAGVAPEEGLQVHTIRAARAISVMF
ncbi:MAG: hypothetical protein QOE41_3341, partial [Mycobacterium sp.]|nr:hypothetical protein [Mycobacterium sp.]